MADSDEGHPKKKANTNLFMQTTDFIDRHIRLIKYTTVYGLAGVGILIVLRRTYALRKFGHVKDIPRDFIKEHTRLRGHVVDVSERGHLLVDHAPVVSVEKFKGKKACTGKLPISLASVELSQLAVPWLHKNILNQHIWFTLLYVRKVEDETSEKMISDNLKNTNILPEEKSDEKLATSEKVKGEGMEKDFSNQDIVARPSEETREVLESIVFYKKSFFRNSSVNRELVRLGLATCSSDSRDYCESDGDREISRHIDDLVRAQKYAERRGLGVWTRPSLRERIRLYPSYLKYRVKTYFNEKFNWKSKQKPE